MEQTPLDELIKQLRSVARDCDGGTLAASECARVADALELAQAIPALREELLKYRDLLNVVQIGARPGSFDARLHAVNNALSGIADVDEVLS